MSLVIRLRAVLAISFAMMLNAGPARPNAQGLAPRSGSDPWVCTAIPRRFWLPISVLAERLNAEGFTVVEAVETREDCYALKLRDRESRESTIIFDPVSAKPLR